MEPTTDGAETKRQKANSRRDRGDRPPDTPPLPPYDWRERWGVWRRRSREDGFRDRRWKFGIGGLEMRWMLSDFLRMEEEKKGRGWVMAGLAWVGGGWVWASGWRRLWSGRRCFLEGRVRGGTAVVRGGRGERKSSPITPVAQRHCGLRWPRRPRRCNGWIYSLAVPSRWGLMHPKSLKSLSSPKGISTSDHNPPIPTPGKRFHQTWPAQFERAKPKEGGGV